MKKNVLIGVLLIVGVVGLGISLSYAFFALVINGSESTTTIKLDAGILEIYYDGGADISASSVIPGDEPWASKTFTVTGKNTSELKMPYTLKLIVSENEFPLGAIKYTLQSTNTSQNGAVVLGVSDLTTVDDDVILGVGYFDFGEGLVHTYIINLYYPDTDEDQSADMGKKFLSYINVIGDEAVTTTTTTTTSAGA